VDTGLLLLRVVLGALLMGHGSQKLFGWFSGHGLEGTGGFFRSLGYRPGKPFAFMAGASELTGGLLLALGLFTPLAGAILIGTMMNAILSAHAGKGPWVTNGGWEYPFVIGTIATTYAFVGPGAASLDNAFGWDLAGAQWGIFALVVGLVVGGITDGYRRAALREPRVRDREMRATA
jgi:putative oxidoreductase